MDITFLIARSFESNPSHWVRQVHGVEMVMYQVRPSMSLTSHEYVWWHIIYSVYLLHTTHSKYNYIQQNTTFNRLSKTRANNSEQIHSKTTKHVAKPVTDHQMPCRQGCQCEGSAIALAEGGWDAKGEQDKGGAAQEKDTLRVLLDRDPANTLPAGHNSRIDSGEDMLFYYC